MCHQWHTCLSLRKGQAISRVLFALSRNGGHLSWTHVAMRLKRPTRSSIGADHASDPIWPFSRRGLPCEACHQAPGALLPHLFTLTHSRHDGLVPEGTAQWALEAQYVPVPEGTAQRRSCGRCVFCGTFPGVTPGGRYPPLCPVKLGLSSPQAPP